MKSSARQRALFDKKIAKYIYATNTPFSHVEHPLFLNMIQALRPGYTPPSRRQIGENLLEDTYLKERSKCASILCNETVTMGLDGWSNIHNEPIICVTLTTKEGDTFLTDTFDTSGTAHTADNLYELAKKSIEKSEKDFKCIIGSIVTDNAANVSKMRDIIELDKALNKITYGCAAHILNLLAIDINYPTVTEQVLQIIKHFRNNHFASAAFRAEKNSPMLTLPSDVRWNSFSDTLENYLKAWPVLVKICEENKTIIDNQIQSLVSNISLKRNAEHYLQQLKPISVALDRVQKQNCSIGEAVLIYKELRRSLTDLSMGRDTVKKFEKRYKMALTPAHFLAYFLDPSQKKDGLELSSDEKRDALQYARDRFPNNSLVPLLMKFSAKSWPFEKYLFSEDYFKEISVNEWWASQEQEICKFNDNVFQEISTILNAKATTANVERMFSSFGLVQSKLRNRLGNEKAAKLVFLFKMLNKCS